MITDAQLHGREVPAAATVNVDEPAAVDGSEREDELTDEE
jgi:hypothetical protein